MEGKEPHIASILQDMFFDTGEEFAPQQVMLIDDDTRNISIAKTFHHRTVVFPDMPLPGIKRSGHMEAGGVTVLHRRQLRQVPATLLSLFVMLLLLFLRWTLTYRWCCRHGALLCISQGSVADFVGFEQGAIVNAANSGKS
jgi:hypothetical protein